jgi:NAD-dependent deacetylase
LELERLNIVISTGAGISAESGIHTYRDLDGLWTKYDPMKVSHIDGWRSDPQGVLDFKNALRRQFAAGNHQPNPAHNALTRLQREWKHGKVTIITQNIDGLHRVAGSEVVEMHGSGLDKFCEKCGVKTPFDDDIALADPCVGCGATGSTRPNVVLFGEMPHHLDAIEQSLAECAIFATVGWSCEVFPASDFPHIARSHCATTYLINKEPVIDDHAFDHVIYGNASEEVPKWVAKLLSQYALRGAS